MYENISFIIGNKTIEVGGQVYDLGVLATDTLNIPDDEIREWCALVDSLNKDMTQYEANHEIQYWRQSYSKLALLDKKLQAKQIFRSIRNDDTPLSEIGAFLKDLNPPEDISEDIWLWLDLDDTPYRYLCCYQNLKEIWEFYRKLVSGFHSAAQDLMIFNRTIHTFIGEYLQSLDVLTPKTYAQALHDCTVHPHHNDDRQTPSELVQEVGFFHIGDNMAVNYFPRETEEGSGEYLIYEEYTATNLRTLLKADFYHALMIGYTIRRCECCGRYFRNRPTSSCQQERQKGM